MDTPKDGPFGLVSHRLGALPILNHFLDRIGLDAALQRWLPEPDRRFKLLPACTASTARRTGGRVEASPRRR